MLKATKFGESDEVDELVGKLLFGLVLEHSINKK
jgi:hypothetical protein